MLVVGNFQLQIVPGRDRCPICRLHYSCQLASARALRRCTEEPWYYRRYKLPQMQALPAYHATGDSALQRQHAAAKLQRLLCNSPQKKQWLTAGRMQTIWSRAASGTSTTTYTEVTKARASTIRAPKKLQRNYQTPVKRAAAHMQMHSQTV